MALIRQRARQQLCWLLRKQQGKAREEYSRQFLKLCVGYFFFIILQGKNWIHKKKENFVKLSWSFFKAWSWRARHLEIGAWRPWYPLSTKCKMPLHQWGLQWSLICHKLPWLEVNQLENHLYWRISSASKYFHKDMWPFRPSLKGLVTCRGKETFLVPVKSADLYRSPWLPS